MIKPKASDKKNHEEKNGTHGHKKHIVREEGRKKKRFRFYAGKEKGNRRMLGLSRG